MARKGSIPKRPSVSKGRSIQPIRVESSRSNALGVDFEKKRVAFTRKDRLHHTHILGSTGTGKSKFMELLMRSDMADRKSGFCLIDPHGSLYEDLLLYASHRHPHMVDRFVLWNPAGETDQILGFNPIPPNAMETIDYVLDMMISGCLKAWGQDNTDRTPRITKWLENLFLTVIANGLTLVETAPLLSVSNRYEAQRNRLLANVRNDMVLDDWEMFASSTNTQRQMLIEGAANRMRKFLRNPAVRNSLGQQEHVLDLHRIMDEGKILLVNLSGGDSISFENTRLLGIMLVNEFFRVAKLRDPRDPQLKPFFLYIDEFANFITRDIARALEECRKFKLFLTLAHQHLAQLREEDEYLYASVLTNCRNKVVFGGLSREDAEIMEQEISTGFHDLKSIKDEMHSTKVRHVEETRTVRGKSRGESRSESESLSESTSSSEGRSLGRGKTQSESVTESETTGLSHGHSESTGETQSRGTSQGMTETAGSSMSNTLGRSVGRSESQTQTTGSSFTENEGTSGGSTRGYSDSRGSTSSRSHSTSDGRADGSGATQHPSGDSSHASSSSQNRGSSSGTQDGSSQSHTDNFSENSGWSHGTSRGQSESRGSQHGTSETDSESRMEGTSSSHADHSSTSDSSGTSHSLTDSESRSETRGSARGRQTGTSETESTSTSRSETKGSTTGKSLGASTGESESVVPFLRPEEYRELTSRTFWSVSELEYLQTARIKNQDVGVAFIKIGSDAPTQTTIEHVRSIPYSPRFSPKRIDAFREKVFAANPAYYLPVEKAIEIHQRRQISVFGEPLHFDEKPVLVLDAIPENDDSPSPPKAEDPFT